MLGIEILLLIDGFATWMMVGIIFFVQVVYLPLYLKYKEHFTNYEKKDLVHMGYLVGPIVFLELLSAIILAFTLHKNVIYRSLSYMNVSLLLLIWIVNWLIRSQKEGVKELLLVHKMHHLVLTTNWFRTIVWSIRGVIVLLMILFSDVLKV